VALGPQRDGFTGDAGEHDAERVHRYARRGFAFAASLRQPDRAENAVALLELGVGPRPR
jgi:hypothetical protein